MQQETVFTFWRGAKRRGFTLIELLIVIAIILILIAIALPNFLEAQVRARVTNAKGALRTMETGMNEHLLDYGSVPADFNDSTNLTIKYRARKLSGGPCPIFATCSASDGGLEYLNVDKCTFYATNMHCPLTSPIRYLQPNETIDTFSDGSIPIGFDSRAINDRIVYGAFWSAGPDRVAGDWARGNTYNVDVDGDGLAEALPYNPTNGTTSRGELWGVVGDWGFDRNPAGPDGSAREEYRIQKTY